MLISTNCTKSLQNTLGKNLKRILFYLLIISILSSCASSGRRAIKKISRKTVSQSLFRNHFTGMMILDAESQDTLLARNSDKYFTPASNTKIFTFYTALQFLPEQIPVLDYSYIGDTLLISGTGDPTQFHPYFQDSTLHEFLSKHSGPIVLGHRILDEDPLGPGWAWEDYDLAFSPERGTLPLYGNVATLYIADTLHIVPPIFKDKAIPTAFRKRRLMEENLFFYDPTAQDTLEIPFKTDSTLTQKLLEQALDRSIGAASISKTSETQTLAGIATDSVLQRMMQESDNFLAEQLLILVSSRISDSLSTAKAREFILRMSLSDLHQMPRWVDGSGLSRYNLFTPESMVHVLLKLYRQIPRKRLFSLLPAGGVSGTLEDWYPGDPDPYIFAKSGTLGNNYNLSGYLITRSGKTLIFSFMNNHFRKPTNEIKSSMQSFLEAVRDRY